ncbi:MAG TPA: hypothetical protein VEQ35_03740, partial [Beijerinckia sp.]|nr:hypothetical protein [Beijerinckia sp.]
MAPLTGGFDEASFNQTPPFEDVDLLAMDLPLREALHRAHVDMAGEKLQAFGQDFGSAETMALARQANENPPRLRLVDGTGDRLDIVEYHPAY